MMTTDARRDAPSFHRNIVPISEVLKATLPAGPGDVLEVGSGSGQHIVAFAKQFPKLTWWPTEFARENIASIDAWRTTEATTNVQPAISLDASKLDWELGTNDRPPTALDAIFSANVIHISPWSVCAGIIQGAGRHLKSGGSLLFYGPFFRAEYETAPTNTAFDQDLRSRDPNWGIRHLDELNQLAQQSGLADPIITEMPANNLILNFVRE
ncbi:MAG: DUF938 domain-containing protein [Pseudomonadota bacterium]